MEERDVKSSPHVRQGLTQAATLPSMHAPYTGATQHQLHQQHQQQTQSQSQSQQPFPAQYAAQPPAQQYYEQRDAHQPQYDYRPVAPQNPVGSASSSSSVSLPPIQHLHGSSASTSTASTITSNMTSQQPTLPPPVMQQHVPASTTQSHAYAPPLNNGDTQHAYHHPPPPPQYSQQPPSMYAPQYQPNQYHHYGNGAMHHHQPPPPTAMMPSNVSNGLGSTMRYGPLPNAQMDPRQMSGGRHKKEIKRRTKTGCLTCRKRRIKCDERHPHCRNCEKSKRECLGYDPVFKAQPAPAPLQPAPMPSHQLPKPDQGYPYAYHAAEDMYASRAPPPMQSQPLTPHSGNHHMSSAGPLADGDHNRGQTQGHGAVEIDRKV